MLTGFSGAGQLVQTDSPQYIYIERKLSKVIRWMEQDSN